MTGKVSVSGGETKALNKQRAAIYADQEKQMAGINHRILEPGEVVERGDLMLNLFTDERWRPVEEFYPAGIGQQVKPRTFDNGYTSFRRQLPRETKEKNED